MSQVVITGKRNRNPKEEVTSWVATFNTAVNVSSHVNPESVGTILKGIAGDKVFSNQSLGLGPIPAVAKQLLTSFGELDTHNNNNSDTSLVNHQIFGKLRIGKSSLANDCMNPCTGGAECREVVYAGLAVSRGTAARTRVLFNSSRKGTQELEMRVYRHSAGTLEALFDGKIAVVLAENGVVDTVQVKDEWRGRLTSDEQEAYLQLNSLALKPDHDPLRKLLHSAGAANAVSGSGGESLKLPSQRSQQQQQQQQQGVPETAKVAPECPPSPQPVLCDQTGYDNLQDRVQRLGDLVEEARNQKWYIHSIEVNHKLPERALYCCSTDCVSDTAGLLDADAPLLVLQTKRELQSAECGTLKVSHENGGFGGSTADRELLGLFRDKLAESPSFRLAGVFSSETPWRNMDVSKIIKQLGKSNNGNNGVTIYQDHLKKTFLKMVGAIDDAGQLVPAISDRVDVCFLCWGQWIASIDASTLDTMQQLVKESGYEDYEQILEKHRAAVIFDKALSKLEFAMKRVVKPLNTAANILAMHFANGGWFWPEGYPELLLPRPPALQPPQQPPQHMQQKEVIQQQPQLPFAKDILGMPANGCDGGSAGGAGAPGGEGTAGGGADGGVPAAVEDMTWDGFRSWVAGLDGDNLWGILMQWRTGLLAWVERQVQTVLEQARAPEGIASAKANVVNKVMLIGRDPAALAAWLQSSTQLYSLLLDDVAKGIKDITSKVHSSAVDLTRRLKRKALEMFDVMYDNGMQDLDERLDSQHDWVNPLAAPVREQLHKKAVAAAAAAQLGGGGGEALLVTEEAVHEAVKRQIKQKRQTVKGVVKKAVSKAVTEILKHLLQDRLLNWKQLLAGGTMIGMLAVEEQVVAFHADLLQAANSKQTLTKGLLMAMAAGLQLERAREAAASGLFGENGLLAIVDVARLETKLVVECVPYLADTIGIALNDIRWRGTVAKEEDVIDVQKRAPALASSLRTLLADTFGTDLLQQLQQQQQCQTRQKTKQQRKSVAAPVADEGGPSNAAASPFRDLNERAARLIKKLDDFVRSEGQVDRRTPQQVPSVTSTSGRRALSRS